MKIDKIDSSKYRDPKGANVAASSTAEGEVRGLSETGTVELQSKGADQEAEEKLQFQPHQCLG